MYAKMSVGLEEALGAIHAMLDEVKSQPEKYWQEACFAIVDERGKLVAFAKMDGPDQICQDVAIRKAWTAAIWRRDIQEVNEFIKTLPPLWVEWLLPTALKIQLPRRQPIQKVNWVASHLVLEVLVSVVRAPGI